MLLYAGILASAETEGFFSKWCKRGRMHGEREDMAYSFLTTWISFICQYKGSLNLDVNLQSWSLSDICGMAVNQAAWGSWWQLVAVSIYN